VSTVNSLAIPTQSGRPLLLRLAKTLAEADSPLGDSSMVGLGDVFFNGREVLCSGNATVRLSCEGGNPDIPQKPDCPQTTSGTITGTTNAGDIVELRHNRPGAGPAWLRRVPERAARRLRLCEHAHHAIFRWRNSGTDPRRRWGRWKT